jgi:photosystem II stability/assembly factor-like uncharacterized protein
MKTRNILLTGFFLIITGTVSLFLIRGGSRDTRQDYEKFLNEQYREAASLARASAAGKSGKMDSPEMAGIRDYFMTIDPSLKAVPTERRYSAYKRTRGTAESGLKSGLTLPEWVSVPCDEGGRTRAIMYDPNDPTHSKVWAGSVTGGLWYNNDHMRGAPWISSESFWPSLSISSLAYDPNNKSIFYAGTGESQTAITIYRESSGRGAGIFRSTDAGASWSQMESTKNFAYVNNVLVRNEDGRSIIYAAVASGIYRGKYHQSEPSDGLYRSADDGATWQQVLPAVPGDDLPFAPSDLDISADNRLYVGTVYNKNNNGGGCILMSDNGIDWTIYSGHRDIILGETKNFPGRVVLSASKSNPNVIYAALTAGFINTTGYGPFGIDNLMHFNGTHVIKSTDRGITWTDITLPGSPTGWSYIAWHAYEISVDPINPNVVWAGALDLYRSTNGGSSWTRMSNWALMYSGPSPLYVHADIHAIVYKPGGNSDFLVGTDGGIFATTTATGNPVSFSELAKGFNTVQAYTCAIHPVAGTYHFLAGLQDNGTNFFGPGKTTYQDMLSGGDGAFCFIDEDEPNIQISSVYNSNYNVWDGTAETKPVFVTSTGTDRGLFINPSDYDDIKNVIWGNRMDPDGSYQDRIFRMRTITGMPTTDLLVGSGTTVPFSCVRVAPSTNSTITNLYLGTESGMLLSLKNAASTPVRTNLTGPDFPTGFISSIDLSAQEDTILVTFANYGIPSIWLSTDKGTTWSNKDHDLPDMPVRWGILHPRNSRQVMLATETGVWTTTDITGDPVEWVPTSMGMGYVRCDQLDFRKADNTVLVATHGRGLYTTVWEPVFVSGIDDKTLSYTNLQVFPNPTDGRFEVKIENPGRSELTIMDLSGRIIISEKITAQSGTWLGSYDLTGEPKGVYVVRASSGARYSTARLIIQ